MKKYLLLFTLAAAVAVASQAQDADVYTQELSYINIAPGKVQEWRQLLRDSSMKVAQMEADSGEIISWTLLRSVYPAGEEARAHFMLSVITAGEPKSTGRRLPKSFELAGVEMTANEYFQKQNALSTLVAAELWRPRIYNGATQKGNYLTINMMQVKDWDTIRETTAAWSPLSQEWIKQGAMTGWIYATKMLPGGSETPYEAYSANMYPNKEAAFAGTDTPKMFEKVHKGKKWDDYSGKLGEARNIATREMWTVLERITKAK